MASSAVSCASRGTRAPVESVPRELARSEDGGQAGADLSAERSAATAALDGGSAEADDEAAAEAEASGPCARNMVPVPDGDRTFCVDMYEASVVEVAPDGEERPHPSWLPVDGKIVRAISEPGVVPQSYISEVQASDACVASGKRLCTLGEWRAACRGPQRTTFPYGTARIPGACHDSGKSPVAVVFGAQLAAPPASRPSLGARPAPSGRAQPGKAQASRSRPARTPATTTPSRTPRSAAAAARPGRSVQTARTSSPAHGARAPAGAGAGSARKGYLPSRQTRQPARKSAPPANVNLDVWTKLNDPRLGQVEGGVGKTGDHAQCVNAFGVFDMMGNVHEWVATDASLPNGTFAGGYWLDTSQNGDGCEYRTQAHAREYHDYSTGFRCCSDAE